MKSLWENVQAKTEGGDDKDFETVMKSAEGKKDHREILAFYTVRTDMRSITVVSN